MRKQLMIAVMAFATSVALAQDAPRDKKTPQERAKAQTERLTKDLGLSADQAAKLEALNLKYAEEMEARRAEQEPAMAQRRTEGKARRDAHDADMKSILTAEQYTKWQKMQEERKEKMKEKRKEQHKEQR